MPNNSEREGELEKFSMRRFVSRTSSFQALLRIKSNTKILKWQNLKKLHFAVKKKAFFISETLSSNPVARFKKFCRPVMLVELGKGKKY